MTRKYTQVVKFYESYSHSDQTEEVHLNELFI